MLAGATVPSIIRLCFPVAIHPTKIYLSSHDMTVGPGSGRDCMIVLSMTYKIYKQRCTNVLGGTKEISLVPDRQKAAQTTGESC